MHVKKTIEVHIIPNAKKCSIVEEYGKFRARLTAPARGGNANKELVSVLAQYFDVRKRNIEIIKGAKSRQKTVEVKL